MIDIMASQKEENPIPTGNKTRTNPISWNRFTPSFGLLEQTMMPLPLDEVLVDLGRRSVVR